MENKDKPIYPVLLRQTGSDSYRVASDKDSREGQYLTSELGLTKREAFAMAAMQGILASGHTTSSSQVYTKEDLICIQAVAYADALLKALEK